MSNLIFLSLLLINLNKGISSNNNTCFEYSCEECNSQEYGNCTKCRFGWTLIDGTCPCFNSSCAVCATGFFSTDSCQLCKKGYVWDNYHCICNISNCEQCGENECLVCKIGYYYNRNTSECEEIKDEDKIDCYDWNCDICFSELYGKCIKCKKGFKLQNGYCVRKINFTDFGSCPYNYFLEGDYCYPNCDRLDCPIKYNNSISLCPYNKCLLCNNNRLSILNDCDNSNECSSIKGCLNCVTNDECSYCNRGYYLLGGLCYKCIEGCSICYNNYSCEYCLSGFELTSDKKCNLTYNFDFDLDKYNKYKEEFLNKTCSDDKCLICTFRNEEEKCKKCINGYDIYMDHQCRKCSSNCLDCRFLNESNDFCLECESGYKINDEGKCSLICSDENCLECYLKDDEKQYCRECKSGYALKNENCSSCWEMEGCDECYFENETEYCIECYTGYFLKDGTCLECSDEICDECYFENGKEYCSNCYSYRYIPYEDKCIECPVENCLHCKIKNGTAECFNCKIGYMAKDGKCQKCSLENCLDCYFYEGKEKCYKCKDGYYLKKDEKNNEQCVAINVYYSNCYINHCKKCLKSGKCVECSDNYYINGLGECYKSKDSNNSNHNSNPSVLATLISIIFFVLLVIIAYIREKEICINLPKQRRVNRDNLNNINNNIIININRSNLNEQRISSNEIILNENELSDEFKRLRITFENKLCQVCKKEKGKYIGDCGCIVCQEHSNFKEVINIEGKFKICFNCGKTIKDLKLIKTSCQICLEEVPSLCHFKCGCAIEVCENCYIKCRKESKKCPACRGNI